MITDRVYRERVKLSSTTNEERMLGRFDTHRTQKAK